MAASSLALSSFVRSSCLVCSSIPPSNNSRKENGFLGTKLHSRSLKQERRVSPVNLLVQSAAASAVDVEDEVEARPVPRLRRFYLQKVVPALKEEFKYKNSQEVPYVKKIVVNCGVGAAAQNAKALESTIRDLSLITGQRPVTTRAKKAIAGFKLRQGVAVGLSVILRGEVMYSFLDRLMNLALPRTRDFQGVNPYSFDGKGNYTLGLPEQSVFPEIRFENIDKERGMDVSIISTAKNDTEGQKLLGLLGMPFKEGTGRSAAAARRRAKDVYKGMKMRKR